MLIDYYVLLIIKYIKINVAPLSSKPIIIDLFSTQS